MDRGAWWAAVHEVAKTWTWQGDLALAQVYNKWNALESSRNHLPFPRSTEKLSSMNQVPGTKNLGNCWVKDSL